MREKEKKGDPPILNKTLLHMRLNKTHLCMHLWHIKRNIISLNSSQFPIRSVYFNLSSPWWSMLRQYHSTTLCHSFMLRYISIHLSIYLFVCYIAYSTYTHTFFTYWPIKSFHKTLAIFIVPKSAASNLIRLAASDSLGQRCSVPSVHNALESNPVHSVLLLCSVIS